MGGCWKNGSGSFKLWDSIGMVLDNPSGGPDTTLTGRLRGLFYADLPLLYTP
jgi:hypothetical protein